MAPRLYRRVETPVCNLKVEGKNRKRKEFTLLGSLETAGSRAVSLTGSEGPPEMRCYVHAGRRADTHRDGNVISKR